MNPGRAPTRLGNDGIQPFLDVPHWLAAAVIRVLRRHRIAYQIKPAYKRLASSDDPDDHTDRLVFLHDPADRIQALVDGLGPPGRA